MSSRPWPWNASFSTVQGPISRIAQQPLPGALVLGREVDAAARHLARALDHRQRARRRQVAGLRARPAHGPRARRPRRVAQRPQAPGAPAPDQPALDRRGALGLDQLLGDRPGERLERLGAAQRAQPRACGGSSGPSSGSRLNARGTRRRSWSTPSAKRIRSIAARPPRASAASARKRTAPPPATRARHRLRHRGRAAGAERRRAPAQHPVAPARRAAGTGPGARRRSSTRGRRTSGSALQHVDVDEERASARTSSPRRAPPAAPMRTAPRRRAGRRSTRRQDVATPATTAPPAAATTGAGSAAGRGSISARLGGGEHRASSRRRGCRWRRVSSCLGSSMRARRLYSPGRRSFS